VISGVEFHDVGMAIRILNHWDTSSGVILQALKSLPKELLPFSYLCRGRCRSDFQFVIENLLSSSICNVRQLHALRQGPSGHSYDKYILHKSSLPPFRTESEMARYTMPGQHGIDSEWTLIFPIQLFSISRLNDSDWLNQN